MKTLTAITKIASDPRWGGLALGSRTKFFAQQKHVFDSTRHEYEWKDTGELGVEGNLQTFCFGDFARVFGLRVKEVKAIFKPNVISKVRITIEVLEEEEWEYTP